MKDKVVLLTGGTSGIGLAAAKMFLQRGARVILAGRNEARGRYALQALQAAEHQAVYLPADVSQSKECQSLVERAVSVWGRLDVLVNSAGIYREAGAEELTDESYAEIMDTNVKGTMFMVRYALPYLKKQAEAAVVNVSSDAGVQGNYGCSLYCASKGAVTLFTRAVALEAAAYKVRVNCVCPGDIATPLTEAQLQAAPSYDAAKKAMADVYPLGRIGEAEEAAAVIVFLASREASFVTGAVWSVDGGITA